MVGAAQGYEAPGSAMADHPRIAALATALPAHRWSQRDVHELLARSFPHYRAPAFRRVFLNGEIEHRYFSFGPDGFDPGASPDDLHRRFAEHALPLARAASERCLARSGIRVRDVDCIVVATCTGYLCPGLTGHLGRALGMRDDVQRSDLVGMGCAGALPALQRAHDYVRAHPRGRALAVAVEVCSACWYVDETIEAAVGNAICADGAAAALIEGTECTPGHGPRGPEILRFETLLEPALLDAVGFAFRGGRLRIVLAKELRQAAGPLSRRAVDRLLERHGVERDAIGQWVIHSGGRRVLDGIARAFEFEGAELQHSRDVLREHGNMSSPTVLFVLERTWQAARPSPGELGVVLTLGPGLAAETALLRW